MVIKFKPLSEKAILPTKAYDSDTGWDVYSIEDVIIPAKSSGIIKVGLQLADITEGYWFKIESRSGIGFRDGIVAFSGIIDNGYRNEIGVKLFNFSDKDFKIKTGDRVAQIVVYKLYETTIEFTDVISDSHRGHKGFGSSGR